MIKKIFFQSSLPRAGSTLLQNIIGQNPEFYVTPTSGVLELLYGARVNYSNSPEFKAQDSELMKKGFLEFCKFGLYGFYDGITDKRYVLDKSRGWGIHYNFLNSFYPNPKIICMIRDPREIFSSMEKNFRKSQHLDSGIINHSKMQATTTFKRVEMWSNTPPIGLAFERIGQMVREGIDKNILFVKFEDLTSKPDDALRKIYNYLDLLYFEHDFNNIQQITREDDSVYGIYGDHTIKSIMQTIPKNSKEILGDHSCNYILSKYNWFFNYFKYI